MGHRSPFSPVNPPMCMVYNIILYKQCTLSRLKIRHGKTKKIPTKFELITIDVFYKNIDIIIIVNNLILFSCLI